MCVRVTQLSYKLMTDLSNYVLTNNAVFYIENNALAVLSPDFTGYSLTLPKRYKALLLISVSGRFKPFSVSDKPLTEKTLYKIYRYLLRVRFIRSGVDDPFPEFETYSNIRINFLHARVFDEKIFINLSKQEIKNV